MDQPPPFELRILGPTELRGPTAEAAEAVVRQPKRLALLAYLALTTAEGFRRRDQVIGLFWPDVDQPQARTYLRKALHGFHEALGVDLFVTRGENEVRLDPAQLGCDAVALPSLLQQGHWREALALYRGDLLEGLFPEGVAPEFQEWLDDQRRRLRELAAQAAWQCSRLEDESGDRKAAAVLARRALELTPDDEDGVRRLMSLLDRQGDRGGALRVYSEWQERLRREFGVEPAPETRRLARWIQAARKGESHETPPTPSPPIAPGSGTLGVAETKPVPDGFVPLARGNLRGWRSWALGAALLAVAFAAGIAIEKYRRGTGRLGPGSVAVLPLRDIAGSQTGDAERMTEELTTALARMSGVTVRPATQWDDAPGQPGGVREIGRRLGVSFVVDGAVQGELSRVRVTLRLVRATDGVSVWAGSYETTRQDPIAAAESVADSASRQMRARLMDH